MNKKILLPLLCSIALMGCDDASETIDKAQNAANQAVDSMQSKLESMDFKELNLDQFDGAVGSASEFAESVNEALNADYTNPKALTEIQEHIANAYSCLVEASSESNAEKLLNKVMSKITNEDAQSLIEKGVESAKEMQECVM